MRSDVDNLSSRVNELSTDLRAFMTKLEPVVSNRIADEVRLARVERLTSSAHERLDTFSIAVAALRDRQNRVGWMAAGIVLAGNTFIALIGFLFITPTGQALLRHWLGLG